MRNKLEKMIALQDSVNKVVHAEWKTQGFSWHRAIWLEAAEAMEWTDYKWWKKTEDNIPQIKLELVDIWHFLLSELIQEDLHISLPTESNRSVVQLKEALESIAQQALNKNTADLLEVFYDIIASLGMSFDELYRVYIGKNVLNRFRQDHGYKDGTYLKTWGGVEDNARLEEILPFLDDTSEFYEDSVYRSLESAYTHFNNLGA